MTEFPKTDIPKPRRILLTLAETCGRCGGDGIGDQPGSPHGFRRDSKTSPFDGYREAISKDRAIRTAKKK